jgi:uncharacterized MAPEG superfamily protein
MTTVILAALILLIIHVWLVPMVLNINNASWLMGSRDQAIEFSILTQRAKRAAANYMETVIIFLTLALLAVIKEVDVSDLALYWLGLRIAYLPLYLAGVPYIRSLVWIGALVPLWGMASALL